VATRTVLALAFEQKLLLRFLVALVIIDFVDPLFALVSAIYRLGIVVGDVSGLTGLGDGISLFVDQSDEFPPLFVGDLDILPDHSSCFLIR
jgi:hypothetical protein